MEKKSIIAIMGPSGVGKTTLGNNLATKLHFAIPRHCTTREHRADDAEGFYRYLSHEEYNAKFFNQEFLISSGDGTVISKENGNFYGVLRLDCETAWELSDKIILFVSYKDIYQIIDLKNVYSIDVVNLTFSNIKEGVKWRLVNDHQRKHTTDDINRRVQCALQDNANFVDIVNLYASSVVCTDHFGIDATYNKVCQDLKLVKRREYKNEK